MQHIWLNKKQNNKLIVFLNGWAMNETAVKHLNCKDFDVLVLFDYRNLNYDFSQFNFEKYDKKYLICWSMGVYISNNFVDEFKNFEKIAINGTNKIIDNNFGIPEKIYKITVKFLNEESCDKFIKNMFNNGKLNPMLKITRTLKELKEELIFIQNLKLEEKTIFNKVIISNDDRIIPTQNQLNYWQNKASIQKINSTHCPFEIFKSWDEIIC